MPWEIISCIPKKKKKCGFISISSPFKRWLEWYPCQLVARYVSNQHVSTEWSNSFLLSHNIQYIVFSNKIFWKLYTCNSIYMYIRSLKIRRMMKLNEIFACEVTLLQDNGFYLKMLLLKQWRWPIAVFCFVLFLLLLSFVFPSLMASAAEVPDNAA